MMTTAKNHTKKKNPKTKQDQKKTQTQQILMLNACRSIQLACSQIRAKHHNQFVF